MLADHPKFGVDLPPADLGAAPFEKERAEMARKEAELRENMKRRGLLAFCETMASEGYNGYKVPPPILGPNGLPRLILCLRWKGMEGSTRSSNTCGYLTIQP